MNQIKEQTPEKTARLAGYLYLIFIILYAFSTLVKSGPIVHGDIAATCTNIMTHVWSFRIGVISELDISSFFSYGGVGLICVIKTS